MPDARHERRSGEQGFALILAILALMLLTFLGLTLATTTSTELQIATNYRWSQQALYNAEAGLDAARIVLSNEADPSAGWTALLPGIRGGSWLQGAAPGPVETAMGRDFERMACDDKGGLGYGRVLFDATTRYENVGVFPTAGGETLNGSFTIWIRRPLTVTNQGQYSDGTATNQLVIVSEGVAPYFGPGGAFTRSRQATRILETRFTLMLNPEGNPCGVNKAMGQEGGSPMGENFNPCAPVSAGATGSLATAFGGAGAGTLDSTGVQ